MADCSGDPSLWDVVKSTIPSLLVICGWGVVYRLQRLNTEKQETRKDTRSRLDRLRDDLTGVRTECIGYYTDVSFGAEKEATILALIDDIRTNTTVLSMCLVTDEGERQKIYTIVGDVVTHGTGGDFQTKQRKALSAVSPQLRSLTLSTARLVERLEQAFQEKYPLR